ncbi:hypothetical protein D9M68_887560 [compost metagenome]
MYSSPATPGGTGRRLSSSTYMRVFQTGRPMEGGSVAFIGALMLAQMVISVGP